MRLNVHDFSGHPFQMELSRELASRGHEVEHTFCPQYITGRGMLELLPSDSPGLTVTPLVCRAVFDKYHPLTRIVFEFSYARVWRRYLAQHEFDATIVCNVPLFSLARNQRFLGSPSRGLPWILWHQDIYSRGVRDEIARRLPSKAARPLARLVDRIEKVQVNNAAHVVAISDTFDAQYQNWHVDTSRVSVIPNWAPLNEIRPVERDNEWSARHGLTTQGLRLLYSGTLGRKHNPGLLLDLLDKVQAHGVSATLTVCSEGFGADAIAAAAAGRRDVQVLGFQPADELSAVLSSGDIAIALLEPDASTFSVPSKVLSYFAAGRPVVALMPDTNPAAKDIGEAGGFVATPDGDGIELAAEWIAARSNELADLGRQARAFAERRFDVAAVADQFERILSAVADPRLK